MNYQKIEKLSFKILNIYNAHKIIPIYSIEFCLCHFIPSISSLQAIKNPIHLRIQESKKTSVLLIRKQKNLQQPGYICEHENETSSSSRIDDCRPSSIPHTYVHLKPQKNHTGFVPIKTPCYKIERVPSTYNATHSVRSLDIINH